MDKKLWNIKRVYECSDVVVANDLLKADWRILAIYIKECRPVYCLGKVEVGEKNNFSENGFNNIKAFKEHKEQLERIEEMKKEIISIRNE